MSLITILFMPILISMVQSEEPTIQLSFNPVGTYFTRQSKVEITCALEHRRQVDESAQLWYVDLRTGAHTPVSRSLLTSPTNDTPDIFKKNNRNNRYRFLGKNHIEINALQMEDSARYECNCPDCVPPIKSKEATLYVMQLIDPVWTINSSWPLHENFDTIIKCSVDDFYPYVQHKILRDLSDITNIGRSTLTNEKGFPQKFVWEATIKPTADWHGTTLHCDVTEGNVVKHAMKTLEVLFDPRFLICNERQYVDIKQDYATIECSYSGNPTPELVWLRRSDRKPLTTNSGITIDTRDESNGKYKSIVKFDRNKLNMNPVRSSLNITGENYYQQLLNNGFLVQLFVDKKEKGAKNITIVGDKSQIKSKITNDSTTRSYSTILVAFLSILHTIIR